MAQTLDRVIERALEEPSLLEAQVFVCLWETERIVAQVRTKPTDPTWDSCFKLILERVTWAWNEREASNRNEQYGAIHERAAKAAGPDSLGFADPLTALDVCRHDVPVLLAEIARLKALVVEPCCHCTPGPRFLLRSCPVHGVLAEEERCRKERAQ